MRAGARSKFNSFFGSSFFLSFVSSVVPQLVSFLGLLFLARLYTPEDYGHLALGMAVAAVLSAIISLRYDAALVVADEGDVFPLIFLVICFSAFVVLVYCFAMFFMGVDWLWVLVFSVCQVSLSLASSYWMRSESYVFIFLVRVSAALLNLIFPLIFFWLEVDKGLVNGLMVASFLVFSFLLSLFFYHRPAGLRCNVLRVFDKYFYFTGKSLPGYLINTLSYQAGYFMIPSYYGVGVAGSYFQAFRVGYFPMSMLSTAASQFFYARASRLKDSAEVRVLIAKVHLLMFFILLPYCIVVSLWPDVLVSFVLGESWMEVAEYLPYLAWFFCLSAIASSTSSVFHLYRRGWFELLFNCVLAIIPVALIVFLADEDFSHYLFWYSILGGISYFYLLVWTYLKCRFLEE